MLRFTTQNGSLYELDGEKRTWARLVKDSNSGEIRAEQGTLVCLPKVEIGRSVYIQDTNILEAFRGLGGYAVHLVLTSPVVSIEETLEPTKPSKEIVA